MPSKADAAAACHDTAETAVTAASAETVPCSAACEPDKGSSSSSNWFLLLLLFHLDS